MGWGLAALFAGCVAGLLCSGCSLGLGTPGRPGGRSVGAARYTPDQVAACKSTRSWHEGWIITQGVSGAGAGVAGSATAIPPDPSVKLGVGLGAVGLGALSLVALIAGSLTGNTYADGHCNEALAQ